MKYQGLLQLCFAILVNINLTPTSRVSLKIEAEPVKSLRNGNGHERNAFAAFLGEKRREKFLKEQLRKSNKKV